jgi:hypothetical protein
MEADSWLPVVEDPAAAEAADSFEDTKAQENFEKDVVQQL